MAIGKRAKHLTFHREIDGKCYEEVEVVPNKKAVTTVRGWYTSRGAEIKAIREPTMGGYVIYARMKGAPPGRCARE